MVALTALRQTEVVDLAWYIDGALRARAIQKYIFGRLNDLANRVSLRGKIGYVYGSQKVGIEPLLG